ncbi:MAG: carboxypeptidase regulatory-like domain-containing protein [bacterium]|nr:carboxypeptidase regulatory-like domain-containing protein [bacterium]
MSDTTSTVPRAAVLSLVVCGLLCGPLTADHASASPQANDPNLPEATVSGRVLGSAQPVSTAMVYAYEVASYALEKVRTDRHGRFLFESLPAGLYKIIATKEGFVPTVELLLRRSPDATQFLELRLIEETVGEVRQAESYWDARRRIPADVLREIAHFPMRVEDPLARTGIESSNAALLEAEMVANGGVEQLGEGYGEAQLTTAQVGIRGEVGGMKVGIDGRYEQLVPASGSGEGALPDGQVRSVAVHLESPQSSKISLLTSRGYLASLREGGMEPVNLEHYQLRWSGPAGSKGSSAFSAQFIEENNYHLAGGVDPADFPESSRTWNFEGSYRRELGERTSLETGLIYRQQDGAGGDPSLPPAAGTSDETVDVFGLASSQIQPRVLVEYGLYSSANDGGLSLMPRGGLVVQLGADWRARTSVARRVDRGDEDTIHQGFNTAFYGDRSTCQRAGEACYEVTLEHGTEGRDSLSIGAIHREYAETLRVYFNNDFFNRLESLFLVRGDSLPELQFRMVRHIAPKVLARLESNIASGGGGIFYATDNLAYENQVRYLVTSLDTRFQQTSTGVFVAFHHLEQTLSSLREKADNPEVEIERLQVMLTQDLSVLADMAAKWAVRVNMELSRGSTPFTLTPSDEMRKKLTGGISVSF